jgi:hypothetical protein
MPKITRSMLQRCLFALLGAVQATGVAAVDRPCDERSARLVARAFVVTSPVAYDPETFKAFLDENASALGTKGKAIRCIRALGRQLASAAAATPAAPQRDYATERFGGVMPPGLEHIPGEVDREMRSTSENPYVGAQELLWLAEVLPAAASGDLEPFERQDSLWWQQWKQIAPQLQMLCALNPDVCQAFFAVLRESLPRMEQVIYEQAMQVR